MTSDEDSEGIWVEGARLERFISAVAFASVGSLDDARAIAEGVVKEDRFGVVEESFNIFLAELQHARQERTAAMDALEASRRQLEEKLSIIERQQAAIRTLSAPMIEAWDRIVTVPLVGILDSARIAEVTARLLERVADRGDRCVILDLTGTEAVDAETADQLVRLVRSAELLGTFCVLTGLRSELASTLVDLHTDLGRIATLRTLKQGLRVCITHLMNER